MSVIIGIDPGLRGAMARLEDERGKIELEPVPIIPAKTRKGRDGKIKKVGRDQYDLQTIRNLLLEWSELATYQFVALDVRVFVEQSFPLPPKLKAGSLAQFQRGVSRGWLWMLAALEIPHELVHPRTWMAEMHRGIPGGDTKQRSILAAQRLFPLVDLRRTARSKKADEAFAEALLIAEYGRRRCYGSDPGLINGASLAARTESSGGLKRVRALGGTGVSVTSGLPSRRALQNKGEKTE